MTNCFISSTDTQPVSVSATWAKLSAVRTSAALLKSSVAKENIVRAYREACIHSNLRAFPPSEDSIAMFLVQLVMYKTALSQKCAKLEVPWLSQGELLRLGQTIQALEVDDFHPLLWKTPLQEHHLQRVTAWTLRSDPPLVSNPASSLRR